MKKSEMHTLYLFGNHVDGLELAWPRILKRYFMIPFRNVLEMTGGEQSPYNHGPEGTSGVQSI